MTALLIYAIVVCTVYMVYAVCAKRGVPESLSATYYDLKEEGWLFQMVVITCGMALMPVWLTVSEESYRYLAFLACAGLIFTGFAPAFRLRLDGMVHYGAAIVCCVSAVSWVIAMGMYPIVLYWAFAGWLSYLRLGNFMWWLEVAVMGSVFMALM